MEDTYQISADTHVLPASIPVPGAGALPVNAYLIKGREPVLIDTQMPMEREAFLNALASLIDPRDLHWIILTHDDRDHTGNLMQVLQAAPQARLVVNFVGVGRMSEEWHLPMERVLLVNPGQRVDVGDRELGLVRPPLFDSPATFGVYDAKTSTLFSSDSFGAFIPAPTPLAQDVPEQALMEGLNVFNRANHPWVSLVDERKFATVLNEMARLEPRTIASSHGPAATGMTEAYLRQMAALPAMEPWVAPDQAAMEAAMAAMTEAA